MRHIYLRIGQLFISRVLFPKAYARNVAVDSAWDWKMQRLSTYYSRSRRACIVCVRVCVRASARACVNVYVVQHVCINASAGQIERVCNAFESARTIHSGRGQKAETVCTMDIDGGTFHCATMLCSNNAQTNDSVAVVITGCVCSAFPLSVSLFALLLSSRSFSFSCPTLIAKSTHFRECRLIQHDSLLTTYFLRDDWNSRKENASSNWILLISKLLFRHKGGSRITIQSWIAIYSLLSPDFSNILKLNKNIVLTTALL